MLRKPLQLKWNKNPFLHLKVIFPFFVRVPWDKFLLLWFLAILMGGSLLWLHYGSTPGIVRPTAGLALGSGVGLLWATTRPHWQKAHCAWCGARVKAKTLRLDRGKGAWLAVYKCEGCGHTTEKYQF